MTPGPAHPLDEPLLMLAQAGFPLVPRPYDALAEQLHAPAQTVIQRLAELRRPGGVIREISGIFDAQALGYATALVAFQVEPPRLHAAGAIVAEHPGVSHCYARQNAWNLWFTLALSPASIGLEATVARLARQADASASMLLPTQRRYKLDVRFGPAPPAHAPALAHTRPPDRPPDATQIAAIRAFQQNLPLIDEPFEPLAQSAGLHTDDLLIHAADFLARGWMRRYAAVLHHRRAGAAANVMVVWRVGESAADAAGAACATLPSVSHCYLRPAGPDWPYTLYTMIHGRSPADCEITIDEIVALTGLRDHCDLWTTHEFKKRRVPLLGPEEARWESTTAGSRP